MAQSKKAAIQMKRGGERERERATTFMRWHVFYDLIKWHLFLDSTNVNGKFFDNFLLDSVFSCVSQITFERYIFMKVFHVNGRIFGNAEKKTFLFQRLCNKRYKQKAANVIEENCQSMGDGRMVA